MGELGGDVALGQRWGPARERRWPAPATPGRLCERTSASILAAVGVSMVASICVAIWHLWYAKRAPAKGSSAASET